MARFKFFLIGSREAPVVDVEAGDLRELHQQLSCGRFIAGHMAEADSDGIYPGVLIATGRVQVVLEVG